MQLCRVPVFDVGRIGGEANPRRWLRIRKLCRGTPPTVRRGLPEVPDLRASQRKGFQPAVGVPGHGQLGHPDRTEGRSGTPSVTGRGLAEVPHVPAGEPKDFKAAVGIAGDGGDVVSLPDRTERCRGTPPTVRRGPPEVPHVPADQRKASSRPSALLATAIWVTPTVPNGAEALHRPFGAVCQKRATSPPTSAKTSSRPLASLATVNWVTPTVPKGAEALHPPFRAVCHRWYISPE